MESPAQPPYRGASRRKAGLETPLKGRFRREGTRLSFAPPLWYDILVVACVAGAPLIGVLGSERLGLVAWGTALAVLFAGIWGALSSERMACDLRSRTYARLEGQGIGKRLTRGSLEELDAVVLVVQELPLQSLGGATMVYRLVLHWRGAACPPLVIGRRVVNVARGTPLQARAGPLFALGQHYAAALGVRFFDNSSFLSPAPLQAL